MLLSPPFLPPALPNETEDHFINRAMVPGPPGDGSFPVSFEMNWHGGIHLTAPAAGGGKVLPVRAIADGIVTFVRKPTKRSTDAKHPLNYRGGWTDDGCVVIKHETDIGVDAASNTITKVKFFSVYMHLGAMAALKVNDRVFRKDELGAAGSIYGDPNRLHLEIVCDDENVEKLTGRKTPFTPTDGRSDVVFGSLWFQIPFGTSFFGSEPEAGKPLPPVVFTNADAALIFSVTFKGSDAETRTFSIGGRPIGGPLTEAGFVDKLVKRGQDQFPQSQSAGVEVVRFGRVLGPDPLVPATAPNWHEVAHASGTGFVDLNAAGVHRFSDADFPSWEGGSFKSGWVLVDGSSTVDGRCAELRVIDLLDINNDLLVDRKEAHTRLNDPKTVEGLSRKICKFPTEWDPATVEQRWQFLTTEPPPRLTKAEFEKLKAHMIAVAFWQGTGPGLAGTHWHFHPREFIRQFRKCVWLSEDELAQCIPKKIAGLTNSTFSNGNIMGFATATTRAQKWNPALNLVMRKYLISHTPLRIAHFLAQVFTESSFLKFVKEIQGELASYAPFYGRGLIQLTNLDNYKRYGKYRDFPTNHPTTNATFSALGWDPDVLIATSDTVFDAANSADTATFFWARPAANNGNHRADGGFAVADMVSLSKFVNGNVSEEKLNGLDFRIGIFVYLKYILLDLVRPGATESVTFDWRRNSRKELLFEADGVTPKLDAAGNQKTGFIRKTHTVAMPLDHQKP